MHIILLCTYIYIYTHTYIVCINGILVFVQYSCLLCIWRLSWLWWLSSLLLLFSSRLKNPGFRTCSAFVVAIDIHPIFWVIQSWPRRSWRAYGSTQMLSMHRLPRQWKQFWAHVWLLICRCCRLLCSRPCMVCTCSNICAHNCRWLWNSLQLLAASFIRWLNQMKLRPLITTDTSLL